ncbi:MAG: HIT domain-containing protein [Candidatus Cloacimonetes bacterium]|nr:HIT domain-containing protein [Candidatus Cloacimonadota bacterium]
MQVIYSPWRLKYILSAKEKDCIFCVKPAEKKDKEHFIVARSQMSFVILNLFPYNNGHIMVVPNKHIASLTDLSPEELTDLFSLVRDSEIILRKVYNPEGINIGMNLGKAAGAGIDEHLHVHLVPRWSGDVNFMTSINAVRVIPESFESAYEKLSVEYRNLGY